MEQSKQLRCGDVDVGSRTAIRKGSGRDTPLTLVDSSSTAAAATAAAVSATLAMTANSLVHSATIM